MPEEIGMDSRGEYTHELDPRFDPALSYIIPTSEYENPDYSVYPIPLPATPEDVLVNVESDEFREKYWGRMLYRTDQLRINAETDKVHPCIYLPETIE